MTGAPALSLGLALAVALVGVAGLPVGSRERDTSHPVPVAHVADPVLPTPHVGAAPSPTWQTDGIAWSVGSAGEVVVAGGRFSHLRPPAGTSGSAVSRTNLAVLDPVTGAPTACRLDVALPGNESGAVVRAIVPVGDGRRVYVGGRFSRVGGLDRANLALVDVVACTVDTAWRPRTSGMVLGLAVAPGAVYVAGSFTGVTDSAGRSASPPAPLVVALTPSGHPAPGSVLPFRTDPDAPVREGGALTAKVNAVAVSPDGRDLVLGGNFDTINGAASRAVAVVDATTGATRHRFPGLVPGYVRSEPPVNKGSAVKGIAVDDTGFYTAHEGTGTGVFDGRLAINWDGTVRWKDGCLGATQAVVVRDGVLYGASHAHDCTAIGAFGDRIRIHLHAQSTHATAQAPTAFVSWWPDTNDGIGEQLGPRALALHDGVGGPQLWVAGEFTQVTDAAGVRVAQQGLTRFRPGHAARPTAPVLQVVPERRGALTLRWRAGWDRDDAVLRYAVYRDDDGTPRHVQTARRHFWELDQLGYLDDDLSPGASHRYRVEVTDGLTTVSSATVAATVPAAASGYAARVRADAPQLYLRLDETGGSWHGDSALDGPGATRTTGGTPGGQRGAVLSDPGSTALAFDGDTARLYGERRQSVAGAFTVETWLRTTTTAGGQLVGLGSSQSWPVKSTVDRVLYMSTDGRVHLGVRTATGRVVLSTPGALHNGAWRHVVGVQDADGMSLWVDGTRVARNTVGTASALPASGFWKLGGDNLRGDPAVTTDDWAHSPADGYWQGSLDEVAVYGTALGGQAIAERRAIALAPTRDGPTDPYGIAVHDDAPRLHWRLSETAGTAVAPSVGSVGGTTSGGVQRGTDGLVTGTDAVEDRGVTLDGSTGQVRTSTSAAAPDSYSVEAWLRTTTTRGGQLAGYGSAATGPSTSRDRQVWIRDDGRVSAAARSGSATVVVTSEVRVTDGLAHHVVVTRDAGTLRLYVDGALAGAAAVGAPSALQGYWRFGGDDLAGLPGAPTSDHLQAELDELAVYGRALPADAVVRHRSAGDATAPDTAPPSAPDGVHAGAVAGSVTVAWRASVDNRGVAGYQVHRTGTPDDALSTATVVATVPGTSASDAAPQGRWYYRVVALDLAGNSSPPSGAVVVDVPDGVPPSAPGALAATVDGPRVALAWEAATDDNAVVGYEVHRLPDDGSPAQLGAATLRGETTATSQDDVAPAGTWRYLVRARDAAGNVGPAAQTVALVADEHDPTTPGPPTARQDGADVVVDWAASSDAFGVDHYVVQEVTPSPATRATVPGPTARLVDPAVGPLTLRVVAVDASGRSSAPSEEVTLTVTDARPPTPPDPLEAQVSTEAQVSLTWAAATDNVGVERYEVHRAGTAEALADAAPGGPTLLASLPAGTLQHLEAPGPGQHRYRVLAVDAVGLAGRSQVVLAVVPDTTPPRPVTGLTATVGEDAASVVLAWEATTDDVAVTDYEVHRAPDTAPTDLSGATLVATVPGTAVTTFTDRPGHGAWGYVLRARDDAGNVGAASTGATAALADLAAPTAPGTVTASQPGLPVRLTWQPSADAFGVTAYRIYRSPDAARTEALDSELLATLPGTATGHEDPAPPGRWTYLVVASDAREQRSAPGGPVTLDVVDRSVPPTVVTLSPQADTYANQSAPTTTYGTATALRSIGGTSNQVVSYLRFALPAAPAGTTLSGASLRLRPTATSGATSGSSTPVVLAGGGWTEQSVTWNARPALTTQLLGTVASLPTAGVDVTTSLDTALLGGRLGGPLDLGLRVSSTDGWLVGSREASTGAARPALVLTFTGAGGGAPPPGTSSVAVTAAADSYAAQKAPTTTYGSAADLRSNGGTDGAQVSYLRFTLPAAPAGTRLLGATLRYATTPESTATSPTTAHTVQLAQDTWTESSLTWESRPAVDGAVLGQITGVTAVSTRYSTALDATPLAGLLGSTTTLAIAGTGTDGLIVRSRHSTQALDRPTLVLTFGP